MITQEYVKELFDYHQDGYLIWKSRRSKVTLLMVAGTKETTDTHQYKDIKIDGKSYRTHRVIFLWHHGWLPKTVDHEDTNTDNNKISNLRPATDSQSCMNRKKQKTPSSSRFKGVSWDKEMKKWSACIRIDRKLKRIGIFKDEVEAANAYDAKAKELFGDFALLNF